MCNGEAKINIKHKEYKSKVKEFLARLDQDNCKIISMKKVHNEYIIKYQSAS